MIKNILIAAAVKPTKGKTFEDVYNLIRASAKEFNCTVLGGIWTYGRGCTNLGLKIHGDNESSIDTFGQGLCLALMPAKWCDTPDEIADGFICEIED
ncbi:MAG: hypothetical protein ACYSUK_11130 [Planctomycetota bacterium]|jgi:hypothetical protein